MSGVPVAVSLEMTRLEGEIQSHSVQLWEIDQKLKSLDASAVKGLIAEVAALKAEMQGMKAAEQQHGSQVTQMQQGIGQTQQQVAQVQQGLTQAQQQVTQLQQTSVQASTEVTNLRRDVKANEDLRQEMAKGIQQQFTQMQQQVAKVNDDVRQEMGAVRQQLEGFQNLTTEMSKFRGDLQGLQKSLQEMTKTMTAMQDAMKRDSKETRDQLSKLGKDIAPVPEMKQELTRVGKDVKDEGRIAKVVEKELKKIGKDMKDADFGQVKVVAQQCAKDLSAFKKMIFDSGVLMPKREPPPILAPEEEPPPPTVGTIELGEDIFAARLLLRLGFIKARQERKKEALEALENLDENERANSRSLLLRANHGSDSESEEEESLQDFDELATGLVVPEIYEGGPGYLSVTAGWVGVCICVMCIQVLIVCVIISHSYESGTTCLDPGSAGVDTVFSILHVAKFAAVLVAGPTMGKELLDTINFVMVSGLLEPGRGWETLISAFVRFLTILLIGVANVMMFIASSDASDVFMNMTALTFIGEMGCFGLDFAKRGVFGHYISKSVTELNFTLNLVSEYPWWFNRVYSISILFTAGFTLTFGALVLIIREPMCGADGTAPNIFLLMGHSILPFWIPDPS